MILPERSKTPGIRPRREKARRLAGEDLKGATCLVLLWSDDVRQHQQHDDHQRHPEQPQNNRHISLQALIRRHRLAEQRMPGVEVPETAGSSSRVRADQSSIFRIRERSSRISAGAPSISNSISRLSVSDRFARASACAGRPGDPQHCAARPDGFCRLAAGGFSFVARYCPLK
jgi:hypothetical protein